MESSKTEDTGEITIHKLQIMKDIRSHEVALAEISSLSSSRALYQRNGNLFFRTTTQKAAASEQKLLDQAKARLQKPDST